MTSGPGITSLKLLVTLDPLLTVPGHSVIDLSSSFTSTPDLPYAGLGQRWLEELRMLAPYTSERPYRLFATNSAGKFVLIPRYLTPLPPPEGYRTRRAVLHLMGQLPYIADTRAFLGTGDLWCTAQETLDVMAGDEEEHAVLLYNYLYWLATNDRPTKRSTRLKTGVLTGYPTEESIKEETLFLALGRAVPEGDTVYVLQRDLRRSVAAGSGLLVINPSSGHVFSAGDPDCPLKEIYCLATPYNIWANIQPSTRPQALKYDVTAADCWRPFFDAARPSPIGGLRSVQRDIDYGSRDDCVVYALELEKTLLQALKTNMRRWRSKRYRSATSFHLEACAVAYDLLSQMEEWSRDGESKEVGDPKEALRLLVESRLQVVLQSRSLLGCPVNIPYSDVEEVMEQLKALRVHETKHPDTEFVVAVRVVPVAGRLVSLWAYLGTLDATPRPREKLDK